MLVYTHAGYPLQLAILAKLRAHPVKRGAITPDVIMIVVGYNEGNGSVQKLRTCLNQDYDATRLKVLIAS